MFDADNVDWEPSINLGHETVPTVSMARYNRAVQRERRKRQRKCETGLTSDTEELTGETEELTGETEETDETMEICCAAMHG